MESLKDYEVFIEDIRDSPKDITKSQLITIINEKISSQWSSRDYTGTVEIDVRPEWKKILQDDGSILWEYEKLGWQVMWYNQKYRTKPTRSWLSFKNTKYRGKKK